MENEIVRDGNVLYIEDVIEDRKEKVELETNILNGSIYLGALTALSGVGLSYHYISKAFELSEKAVRALDPLLKGDLVNETLNYGAYYSTSAGFIGIFGGLSIICVGEKLQEKLNKRSNKPL